MLRQKIQYLITIWLATAGMVSGQENLLQSDGFEQDERHNWQVEANGAMASVNWQYFDEQKNSNCLRIDVGVNNTTQQEAQANQTVDPANAKILFGAKQMNSLQEAISSVPNFYDRFGGLKINADYLLGISAGRAKADSLFIKETGLKVVVDLSALINGYTNISFDVQHKKMYEAGTKMYAQIFKQMKALDLNKALFVLHSGTQNRFTEGIDSFCVKAAEYDVELYLCDFINIKRSKVDSFIEGVIAGSEGQNIDNLFNANNAFIFLRSKRNGYNPNIQFPFSESGNWPGLSSGKSIVIDAEYLNAQELQNDISQITQ